MMAATALTRIPFNRPFFTGTEFEYIRQALERGQLSSGGAFGARCEKLLEESLGAPRVLLTSSCTHALEMAALLLDIQPGEEVIVPTFTFVSTANAFVNFGARPVFVDIRPETLNLDVAQVESKITRLTRAIIPVHYGGVGCDLDRLVELAAHRGVAIVEDNAHGLFGRYRGRYLGTFGSVAAQSFHETKNFTCGEGGALVINDPALVARAEVLRDKGTDRSRFFRGEVDKYTWVDIGSSWGMAELLAAFLFAQLEQRQRIWDLRRQAWDYYQRELAAWAAASGIGTPLVPSYCEQAYHMYYLLLPSLASRQALIAHLAARDILGIFHYQPLHLSKMGQQFGGKRGDHPVSEHVSERLLRIPLYNQITRAEQDRVIAALHEFTP
jgi:dTDP-4-amino-4,6-dideoxygalactose transaminase